MTCDRYIAKRLDPSYRSRPLQTRNNRKGQLRNVVYKPDEAIEWLVWLAQLLSLQQLSRLYLESLQPNMSKRSTSI